MSVVAAILDEVVRLYDEQFGRGRRRVRTYWCSDDVLMTVLEETSTPPERNLATLCEDERVRLPRHAAGRCNPLVASRRGG